MLTTTESKTISKNNITVQSVLSDPGVVVFVWGVWLFMLLIPLVCIAKYGSKIPFREDLLLIAPLTGNEPDLAKWLWAQHVEHRIPLPKLILLFLLKFTNGDFRIGMLFNVFSLGAISFAMILVARKLRGGRTSFADAFFPIALLHLGNWDNLFWSWMIVFIIPTVLTLVLLLVLVGYSTLSSPVAAVIAGTCLVLLPLCGANGLLIVPLMALWLIYSGIHYWQAIKIQGSHRWISFFLIGSAVIALCISALYFVNYERAPYYSPSRSFGMTIDTAIKLLAFSFGQAAEISWNLSRIFTIGFLLSSAVVVVLWVLNHKNLERHHAMGVLFFFVNFALFALVIGWGRAENIRFYNSWWSRYIHFEVPALCAAFFIWELYGSPKLRSIAQIVLFSGMFIALPFNMKAGLDYRSRHWQTMNNWQTMNTIEKELLDGTPCSIIAERHGKFLVWWTEAELISAMQMLHDAGITPFAQMKEDQFNQDE